ncbi:MAG: hypothetical protein AAF916_07430 [Planctomycetota bacterium]
MTTPLARRIARLALRCHAEAARPSRPPAAALTLAAALLLLLLAPAASAMMHPQMGRFLQRDPLGYVDGMNTYEKTRSHPSLLDPTGLLSYTFDMEYFSGGGRTGQSSRNNNIWKLASRVTMKYNAYCDPDTHKAMYSPQGFTYTYPRHRGSALFGILELIGFRIFNVGTSIKAVVDTQIVSDTYTNFDCPPGCNGGDILVRLTVFKSELVVTAGTSFGKVSPPQFKVSRIALAESIVTSTLDCCCCPDPPSPDTAPQVNHTNYSVYKSPHEQ